MVVITKPKPPYPNYYPDHLDGEVSFVFAKNIVKQYSYAKRIIISLPPSHDLKSKQPTNHTETSSCTISQLVAIHIHGLQPRCLPETRIRLRLQVIHHSPTALYKIYISRSRKEVKPLFLNSYNFYTTDDTISCESLDCN